MVVKPIINIVTKYTDDIVGFGVRKWTKPTSFEGLRLVPQATCDVFKASGVKDYLSADFIKSLLNIKGKTQIETATLIKDEVLTAMKYKNPSALRIIENPISAGAGSFNTATGKITLNQMPESKEELIAMLYHELDHMDKQVKVYKALGADSFEALMKRKLTEFQQKKFKWNKDFYETMSKDVSLEGFNVNRYKRAISNYPRHPQEDLFSQCLYYHNPLEKDAYALQKKVLTTLGKDDFVVADTFPKSYLTAVRTLFKNPGKVKPYEDENGLEGFIEGLYLLAKLNCVKQTPDVKKLRTFLAQGLDDLYNGRKISRPDDIPEETLSELYNRFFDNKTLKEMGQKPSELVQSWLEQAFK